MRLRAIALGIACATALCAQYRGHHFSWQESCFNHPGLPYCQGNEYAVKPTPPPKNGGKTVVTDPVTGKAAAVIPTGIDWRFADPEADAVAGINVTTLMASPIGHDLIAQWATSQGIAQPEIEKLFEALLGIDQLAVFVHGRQKVVMLTGRAAAWRTASNDPDWKSAPAPGGALLLGNAGAVDQASQRLSGQPATPGSARPASDGFWAVLSGALLGADSDKAGLKRLMIAASWSDRLSIDTSFELIAAPDAHAWPASLPGATVEGGAVHLKSSLDASALAPTLNRLAGDPILRELGSFAKVAESLPTNQPAPVDHSKPVIYGLDDGPRQLNR